MDRVIPFFTVILVRVTAIQVSALTCGCDLSSWNASECRCSNGVRNIHLYLHQDNDSVEALKASETKKESVQLCCIHAWSRLKERSIFSLSTSHRPSAAAYHNCQSNETRTFR